MGDSADHGANVVDFIRKAVGKATTVHHGRTGGGDAGPSEWRIFRTATTQTANLGGIAGADALCAAQAMAGGLDGEFKAWLSTVSSPVSDRVTHASGPYVLVNGTRIADDWDDLVDAWTENITPACSTLLGLYCIEQ